MTHRRTSVSRWMAVAAGGATGVLLVAFAANACVGYLDADAGASMTSDVVDSSAGLDAGCDYACLVLQENPIVYLRFDDDATATQALDSSGHGRHGEYPQAGVTKSVEGCIPGEHAVQFAGTGPQQITMPPFADFDGATVAFSVELWVKPAVVDGNRFLLDHEAFAPRRGWVVEIAQGDAALEFYADDVATGVGRSTNKPLTVGQWHHVVFTYSSESKLGLIWVDATVVFSDVVERPTPLTKLDTWSVGKQNCTPCEGPSYAGVLDEVAIYDHLLDQSVVDRHYRAARH